MLFLQSSRDNKRPDHFLSGPLTRVYLARTALAEVVKIRACLLLLLLRILPVGPKQNPVLPQSIGNSHYHYLLAEK